MKKMKVKLIIVWIGKLPNFFNLWTYSASLQKNVDFLIFSDQAIPDNLPKNIQWEDTTLVKMQSMISEKLGYSVKLSFPYKLCDYKVVYGILFQQYLTEYTHWGFCDIDLVFGCLDNFITPKILDEYDKLFYRGHLCIIKNTTENNNLFRESEKIDAKRVFSSDKIFYFDEWYGITQIFEEKKKTQFFSDHWVGNININTANLLLVNSHNYSPQIFIFNKKGVFQLYYDNAQNEILYKEFMYIHFEKQKFMNFPVNISKDSSYLINSFGFHEIDESQINLDLMKKSNTRNYKQFIYRAWQRAIVTLGFKESLHDYYLFK